MPGPAVNRYWGYPQLCAGSTYHRTFPTARVFLARHLGGKHVEGGNDPSNQCIMKTGVLA